MSTDPSLGASRSRRRHRVAGGPTEATFRGAFAWVLVALVALVVALGVANLRPGSGLTLAQRQALAAEPAVAYLHRADDGDDEVRALDLATGDDRVLLSAGHIQEFRLSEHYVIAVETLDDHTNRVHVVDRASGEDATLALPAAGTVRMVATSDRDDRIGLLFTAQGEAGDVQVGDRVMLYGLPGAVGGVADVAPTELADAAGEAQQAVYLARANAGDAFVMQQYDRTLSSIAPDGTILALGSADYVLGFAADDDVLLTMDGYTRYGIDPALGGATKLDVPRPDGVPEESALLEVGLATTQGRATLLYQVAKDGASSGIGSVSDDWTTEDDIAYQELYAADEAGDHVLMRVDGGDGQMLRSCLSPSGSFVAVTRVPPSASYDDDWVNPGADGVETVFVDTVSGVELASVDGFDASWCYPRTVATETF